jgi:nucleoside-diphosphate-sugar epimerase
MLLLCLTSFSSKDPNEIVSPAVDGTKSILRSIKNLAPTVKRVIITSSFAAIVDASKGLRPNYVYSEKDWNPVCSIPNRSRILDSHHLDHMGRDDWRGPCKRI